MTSNQFKDAYKGFYEASRAAADAAHNKLGDDERKAFAAKLVDSDPFKTLLLHGRPSDWAVPLSGLADHRKTAVMDSMGDGTSLEAILEGMGKDFVEFAIQATKPKIDYTGPNAGAYKKASEIRKRIQATRELAESRDAEGLQKALMEDYEAMYKDNKEGLAMARAAIEADERTVARLTQIKMVNMQKEVDETLKDKKAGYVVATRSDMQTRDDFPLALVKLQYNLDNSKKRDSNYLE